MYKFWTKDEVKRLVELFPTHTYLELSQILNRPLHGTKTKCNDLGLKKSREYQLAYLAKNRDNPFCNRTGISPSNKKEKVIVVCKSCSNNFSVIPARKHRAKFCSRKCLSVWMSSIKGVGHWHYRLETKKCKMCNNEFTVKPAKVKNGEGIFCSRRCLGSYTSMEQSKNKNPTSIEVKVGDWLEELREEFIPQKPIGPWCVDFYLPKRRLIIECDGDYWHSIEKVKERDTRKDFYLKRNGMKVLRLTESSIRKNNSIYLKVLLMVT